MRSYLDIETGPAGEVTVLGIYIPGRLMLQLVADEVTEENILWYLTGVSEICTYNGNCFDLPVIRNRVGVDLKQHIECVDLRYACQRQGLKGGLKAVERSLGITRRHPAMGGWDAVRLWSRWIRSEDAAALRVLLEYNQDDCINLCYLEALLDGAEPTQATDHDYLLLPPLP
ncbi:MAG: ribonuclease H-like domain-containing protein [Candidatus Geothermincolia bacterium]